VVKYVLHTTALCLVLAWARPDRLWNYLPVTLGNIVGRHGVHRHALLQHANRFTHQQCVAAEAMMKRLGAELAADLVLLIQHSLDKWLTLRECPKPASAGFFKLAKRPGLITWRDYHSL